MKSNCMLNVVNAKVEMSECKTSHFSSGNSCKVAGDVGIGWLYWVISGPCHIIIMSVRTACYQAHARQSSWWLSGLVEHLRGMKCSVHKPEVVGLNLGWVKLKSQSWQPTVYCCWCCRCCCSSTALPVDPVHQPLPLRCVFLLSKSEMNHKTFSVAIWCLASVISQIGQAIQAANKWDRQLRQPINGTGNSGSQ